MRFLLYLLPILFVIFHFIMVYWQLKIVAMIEKDAYRKTPTPMWFVARTVELAFNFKRIWFAWGRKTTYDNKYILNARWFWPNIISLKDAVDQANTEKAEPKITE